MSLRQEKTIKGKVKMAEKSFLEIFQRYVPTKDKRILLESVLSTKVKYQKEPMRVEAELSFASHVDPELIYEIEDELRALYGAESFKILPHFPPEIFEISYFPEIAAEAALCGAITNGFFSGAEFSDNGEMITIGIPYFSQAVSFITNGNTEAILANILRSRYGIERKIQIVEGRGAEERRRVIEQRKIDKIRLAETENREKIADEIRARRAAEEAVERANDPHYDFEKKAGISAMTGVSEDISDTLFKRGCVTYKTDGAELIYGEKFDIIEPTPLSAAEGVRGQGVFLGTVFFCDTKESRSGDKVTVTIGISDGASGIYVKKSLLPDEIGFIKAFKSRPDVAVFARPMRDKFTNELFLSLKSIMKIGRLHREDNAPEKRVELHLHSNMSQMDGLTKPKDIIDTAIRWGHRAIAVTDHGNVQGFPEVMLELEKHPDADLKVLYGMEGYFVDDTARCIFGSKYPAFDDEMVVFDLETTGLSNRTCKIIEIGAVKIKAGEILEVFNCFVDPEEPITEQITALTSITDDMVKGAPKEREAVESFLKFAGDSMLIAHNAGFDVGFIRVACERQGFAFTNTYLDTVGLSRYLNSELKKHTLDSVANYYGLGDFHHHRASDDAEILARIFFEMQKRLKAEGVVTFDHLLSLMSEKADPLQLKMHHIIILAKNLEGLKNLYKLVSFSYLDYYKRKPRIPKTVLEQYREGLILGSACVAGELYSAILDGKSDQEIEDIASFYDYLEIQPVCNNSFLIEKGTVADEEGIRDLNRRVYAIGKKLGKPVCATCDVHFLNEEHGLYRHILLAGMKMDDGDGESELYLRTTDEMLEEFSYFGDEIAREIVIENPNKIADMCEKIRPIPEGRYEPDIPGAADELTQSCWDRAHAWYGDELPEVVEKRLDRELTSIIKNGFAVLYMIAVKLVAYSESLGYLVGSRGSVGSSFVATMSGISEVNPLPPHYRCPKCRYSEFFLDGSVGSGFDLPDKNCPVCGEPLIMDGHDIPFETFLGFYGDKSPDIDLNFSGDVQGKVHKYTEELFGEGHVFRAGTIGTLADKTAWGYINKYLEEKKVSIPRAQVDYMVSEMVGIKRTTSQHPGGIIVVPTEYEIYDFSPVQHPADDPNSDIITTHYQFSYLHDTILKLDELGHDMPTKYKMLEKYTNTSVLDVKMNDKSVYELFHSTAPLKITPEDIGGVQLGTFGIPEMGTRFLQKVLMDAQPKNFADLLQISGLTHGTGCWLGNADELIKAGTCNISNVIGCRDDIMNTLIRYGLDNSAAFKIMESVRKGKGLTPEWEAMMREHGVPDWYMDSCKKIKYMFPKAHAAAYVMSAIRLCWYKIYYPMEFYAAFLTVAPGGFNAEIVSKGYRGVSDCITEIEKKQNEGSATAKDNEMLSTMQLVREAIARGVEFLGVDLKRSDSRAFLPENGKIRMPFNSLPGLGDTAAEKIFETMKENPDLFSIQQLREKSGISKSIVELLRSNGVLTGLTETNQLSLF